ncbi:MAG TPA: dihydrofolate reductase family protein [Candidatus Dormibacteraeota bacterium]|nr:dihydrofolate reductase family protein [Candidatus Dormibacteraeota bacterium]
MSKVICHQSISIDGFSAGPNQSLENPIGEGGMRLHEWMFETAAFRRMQGLDGGSEGADSAVVEELASNTGVGAHIMGRNMFAVGRGEWDLDWRGWWGPNPPYHDATFVLTHYPRDPIPMEGGTTFYFVTDGIESALRQAREAAGTKDVQVAGGASTVRQFLRAGLLDELSLHLVPTVLGSGERLLENVGEVRMTPVEVIASPAVTHIRYRIER